MSATLTQSGIDQLLAAPVAGGWRVAFRSANLGLHHQLYVNGRLADWTDTPEQREFRLDELAGPARIAIAAVPAKWRTTDFAHELGADDRDCPWVYRPLVVRSTANGREDVIEVLDDGATGLLSETPLACVPVWPEAVPRWAFGEDAFGGGGFGYDGLAAPGFGMGAFGAGPLGLDAELIDVAAALSGEGAHQVVLRTRSPAGRTCDAPPVTVNVPLPAPPAGLSVVAYDHQAARLTLEITQEIQP